MTAHNPQEDTVTVTANPAVDPADLTAEDLIAESLRLVREADRAHAAGLSPNPSRFVADSSLYSGELVNDEALSYAEHTRQQANTLALLALAKS